MQSHPIDPPAAALLPRSEASIRNLPVNLFGSVMGLSGLAHAWRLAHKSLGAPALIGEAIGAFAVCVFVLIALGYLVKLVRHPDAVRAEFRHPVTGNFFGTVAISILLVSSLVRPYSAAAANIIWAAGALATFSLSYFAVARLLRGRIEPAHIGPSWLISCVATLDIAVTGGQLPMAAEINFFAGAVGAVLALLLTVLIINRLVHLDALAPALRPSLMILVAPFAVGFLAYCNIAGGVDRFAGLLFYGGLFLFAVIAPKIFRRNVPFSPAWWAMSFPVAALVNAALKYAEFRGSGPLWVLAVVLLGALSLTLAVLTVRTIRIVLNQELLT